MRILLAAALTSTTVAAQAGSRVVLPVTSGDQIGLAVQGKARLSGGVAALVGMWSDDGALEFGGFDDRSRRLDPSITKAAEIASGRSMKSRGVRLTGSFYRASGIDRRGWTLSIDGRMQRVSDVGAAVSGTWLTQSDSRLTLASRLRF